MKRKLSLIMAAILVVLAFTACDGKSGSKAEAARYTNYIEAIMDCSYRGELNRYTEVVDATEAEAEEVYYSTVEYYAYELMAYNEVAYDYVSEDLFNQYVELAKRVMAKAKYNVNEATKVEDDYQVKVEIYPIDFNDITTEEIENYIDEFNKMLEGIDTTQLTEEQIIEYEEMYGQNVLSILEKYEDQIGYKDVVSKVVIIEVDEDGYYGISDEDWYDIDDYVVDMK